MIAPQLGALAIEDCSQGGKRKVKQADVDYVIMGQVVPAGCGQVPSRQATILAGLPESVPSITINKVCSSGIKTIDLATQMIQLGRADIIIAGGWKAWRLSFSPCPMRDGGNRMGLPKGNLVDLMVYDGLWDAFYDRHMAIHGSETSDEFRFTREDNDKMGIYLSDAGSQGYGRQQYCDENLPRRRQERKGNYLARMKVPSPRQPWKVWLNCRRCSIIRARLRVNPAVLLQVMLLVWNDGGNVVS